MGFTLQPLKSRCRTLTQVVLKIRHIPFPFQANDCRQRRAFKYEMQNVSAHAEALEGRMVTTAHAVFLPSESAMPRVVRAVHLSSSPCEQIGVDTARVSCS